MCGRSAGIDMRPLRGRYGWCVCRDDVVFIEICCQLCFALLLCCLSSNLQVCKLVAKHSGTLLVFVRHNGIVPVTDMRPLRGRCGKRLFQMLEVLISVCCHLFFFNLWYLVDVCSAQWDCVCIKMRPLRGRCG